METKERYHHGNVPDAVVSVALEQLDHQEVSELSLRGLAREIGVSATAVYRHFADKTELVAAIADRGFARLAERFEAACPIGEDPASPAEAQARLIALGRAYLDFAVSAPELFRVMFGKEAAAYRRRRAAAPERTTPRPPPASEGRVYTFRYLEYVMAGLEQTGLVANVRPIDVNHAWAVIHGYAHLLVGQEDLGSPAQVSETAAGRIIASVVTQ